MLNMNCWGCRKRLLPLPDLSRKIEGGSVSRVYSTVPSIQNVTVSTEDGAPALFFFRPNPGGFDSSRVSSPGNLKSKAKKKMLMPGGLPGGLPGGQPGGGRGVGADWCIIVILDTVTITHFKRLISHVPNLFPEVTALTCDVWITSFKFNTTLPNLRMNYRFNIWFRSRISHVPNIMH